MKNQNIEIVVIEDKEDILKSTPAVNGTKLRRKSPYEYYWFYRPKMR